MDKSPAVGWDAWSSHGGAGQVCLCLSCNVLVPALTIGALKVSLAPDVLHLARFFQNLHALPLPCWCVFRCLPWLVPSWESFPTAPPWPVSPF